MMKSFIRFGATLGLVGSTFLGAWGSLDLKALALPQEQILQKLKPVPVFTITDQQGAPLVASGENNAKVAGVFISQQDAQNFVSQLQKQKPDIGSKVRVIPVSLGEVYKLSQDSQKQANGLNFQYVPKQSEVEIAKTVPAQGGQKYQGGVPLFMAKAGKQQGYLTVEKDKQQLIPMFFEKSQLEEMVATFKKQKPDLASTIAVEVVPLEVVIANLQKSEDGTLNKILLVPPKDSIDFVRQSLQQSPNQAAPAPGAKTPAPAPKK
ncbi:MAG: Tic22 family protein [Xenococcaceae cyanobacterium]